MSKEPAPSSPQRPASPQKASDPPQRLFPGWIVRIILIALLLVILFLRLSIERIGVAKFDMAAVNLATYAATFIALFTLWIWFTLRSTYPTALRGLAAVGGVLAMAFVVYAVRFDGITGNWIPTGVRWSWEKPRDFARAKPTPVVHQPVDTDTAAPPEAIATTPDDFPQFLGPNRNGYLPSVQLSHDWQATPPKLLWRQEVGAGWSGFVVVADRAVTLEQYGDEEWITCRSMENGEVIWSHGVRGRHSEFMGGDGPRSTPAIHESQVYAVGATGVVTCLHLANGQVVWQDNLRERYGLTDAEDLKMIMWGRSNSPLIYNDLCIVPAGGKKTSSTEPVSLIAYDKDTGEKRWEAGNTQISYASPTVLMLAGKEQIVSVNESNITGHEPATGKQLWDYPWPGHSNMDASASQPHPFGESEVFISKGYDTGSALFRVAELGGEYRTETLWTSNRLMQTKFTNAVLVDGFAYGLSDGILQCIDVAAGKEQWRAGRYGHGQILAAGDVLLVQTEKKGELVMVALDPQKHRELGRITTLTTPSQAWNNLCLVGRKLLVRNADEAVCFELP